MTIPPREQGTLDVHETSGVFCICEKKDGEECPVHPRETAAAEAVRELGS